MKNNLKKLLCAALSTAMIAGSIVLPMTASADDTTGGNYAVTLDGNTATIHSSSNAYAIIASYDSDNGTLQKLDYQQVSDGSKINVPSGARIMLLGQFAKYASVAYRACKCSEKNVEV